jgi:hypothetical protein
MVHDPEPADPEDGFPEDWDENDDQFLLFEDDFDSKFEEEELDLLQEMREEAAAGEWIVAAEWLDERDQPDG